MRESISKDLAGGASEINLLKRIKNDIIPKGYPATGKPPFRPGGEVMGLWKSSIQWSAFNVEPCFCEPLPTGIGFGFGSPLGHPRETQGSRKGFPSVDSCKCLCLQ